ncbi:class E sortase [Microbacterium sp. zg.Y625]|uniref:class E sortase n=1 Tax=Microbacterium jiangjiandongii TaxID=3049071 RepID=UPI00214AEEEF|nr:MULTISPECIES: class E sortase [unclassified Microbacterium]MCR2794221.1 class E sortase [Microbacterium sp. zg.Y625]WIM25486.1 class E sortase [Microbacterium sp. zg-Y625]
MSDPTPSPLRRRRRAASRGRVSVVGVIGEILITLGVVVLLYVVWQLWIGDAIIGAERQSQAREITREWGAQEQATPEATPAPSADPQTAAPEPVVPAAVGDAEIFGALHIPRFGDDWVFPVAEGISKARVLDPIGVGHYPGTAMPGDMGNVALAAHRYTQGAPFENVPSLQIGDAIVLETEEGWYTYRFRNMEYVRPDEVSVLEPVPQRPGVAADGRYLTLTTCSPMWSTAERLAAYAVFESFTPRADGAPDSLASTEGA